MVARLTRLATEIQSIKEGLTNERVYFEAYKYALSLDEAKDNNAFFHPDSALEWNITAEANVIVFWHDTKTHRMETLEFPASNLYTETLTEIATT